jgi:hypothetical protein
VIDAKELDDETDQAMEEAERHGVAGSPFRSCLEMSTQFGPTVMGNGALLTLM